MEFRSALVLFAHPDDAEFMAGGTIARWCREGTEVHYVVATDGSAGSNEPDMTRELMRPIRKTEQEAAARVLGVKTVTFLGEVDGTLEVNIDTRRKVCREVRRIRPEVILAPDPSRLWSGNRYINHWDHKAAGLLALTVIMPDAPTRPMFPELLEEGLEPYEVPHLWLSSNEPDTYVDVTDTMETKLASLREHVSQGAADAEKWVRERARELGLQADCEYAEGFKVFRFIDEDEEEQA